MLNWGAGGRKGCVASIFFYFYLFIYFLYVCVCLHVGVSVMNHRIITKLCTPAIFDKKSSFCFVIEKGLLTKFFPSWLEDILVFFLIASIVICSCSSANDASVSNNIQLNQLLQSSVFLCPMSFDFSNTIRLGLCSPCWTMA